jgi:hypothetical protein
MRSWKKAMRFQNSGSSKPFADLGQGNPVGVIEAKTTLDLVPETPIFSGQVPVTEQ